MARSGAIVTHPTSGQPTKPSTKGAWPRRRMSPSSGNVRYVKSDGTYGELPPGPGNFIVRTPYPLAPPKEDQES